MGARSVRIYERDLAKHETSPEPAQNRDGDVRAIEMMTAKADRTACRLCTECLPHCPQNVPIAEILRFERYALDDGDWRKARTLYRGLEKKAAACAACGTCLAHCPQGLAIPDRLAAVHSLLFRG